MVSRLQPLSRSVDDTRRAEWGAERRVFHSRYHPFITDRAGEMLTLEADHRRHAEIENAIRDLEVRGGAEPPAIGQVRRQRRL